jgi:flagellar basal body-associated protein FliL
VTLDEIFDDLDRRPHADAFDRREGASRSKKKRSRRIVHAIVWPVLALLLIGGGIAAWMLYNDAMSVRADLEKASAAVEEFQTAATAQPPAFDQLQPIAERLAASA